MISDAVEPRDRAAQRAAAVVRRRRAAARRSARARCPRRQRGGSRTPRAIARSASREARPAEPRASSGSRCRGSTAGHPAGRTRTAASHRPRPCTWIAFMKIASTSGPLFAVDLDVDVELVHQLRGRGVLEALVRHHVAPVAGRVADRHEHRLVASARASANAASPHGHQSTGLSACCRRYGELSAASRFGMACYYHCAEFPTRRRLLR